VNIATLRLSRKHRGGDAFMVIELDEAPSSDVGEALKLLSWVRWAHRIDKVGG
jgi:L-serine dehydratase